MPEPDAAIRVDPVTGTQVQVVPDHQGRPNRPGDGCPFCVGGLEAPDPYQVRSFPNRWPAVGGDRCEVVLYSPDHSASLASVDAGQAVALVGLWADRTRFLGERPDVGYVLIFENRGAAVAADPEPVGGLAGGLTGAARRLDLLFGAPMPYMLWVHQRPTDGRAWETAHLHVHVGPRWRDGGGVRYLAAAEQGAGVLFNPVEPSRAAERLRRAGP